MNIAQQIGEARSPSLDSAATDYTRYVKILAHKAWLARGGYYEVDPLQLATAKGASSRLQKMLEMRPETIGGVTKNIMDNAPVQLPNGMQQKAAVSVGSIDGWGASLAAFQQASTAFLQSLAPFSAFDRLLNDNAFTRLPMRSRIAIRTDAAIGSTTSELANKPVLQMSFSQAQMPVLKAIGQVVLADELILLTNDNSAFVSELQKAIAIATDVQFLAVVADGTGVASSPSTGLTAAQFLADLGVALQAIQVGVGSKLYLILPVSVFNTVSLLRDGGPLIVGGKIGSITPIASAGATTDGVLLDAGSVGAASDLMTTKVSNQASIVMQDNPTAGSHQHISMFQTDSTVILSERFFSASVLRSSGILLITNMVTA